MPRLSALLLIALFPLVSLAAGSAADKPMQKLIADFEAYNRAEIGRAHV